MANGEDEQEINYFDPFDFVKFYEALGAKAQSEWIGYRLEGDSLLAFANS